MKRLVSKMDMGSVRRKSVPPKKTPKREVFGYDMGIKLTPKRKIVKKTSKAEEVPTPQVTIKPKYRTGAGKIIPVIAANLIVALFIQGAVYLNHAKSSTGIVLGAATSAYSDLDAANKSLSERDFQGAKDKFSSAQLNLAAAQEQLDKFKALVAIAPPANSADKLLTGAFFLAEAGKNLTKAMQLFDELSVNSEGISTAGFTDKLQSNHNLLNNSLTLLGYAQENFNSVSGLPKEYDVSLSQARSQINSLTVVLSDLVALEDLFLSFFGKQPKTYLLVFQNYDEMRATGGFIGTYGVLKYENGSIKQLKIESIYNIDGSLTKQIAAPGPFQPDIKKWALRDANFFVDFPTTAEKLLQFFEMESQTADGVLAITPQIFSDILNLIGPVEMPEYGVTLNAENFQDTVQQKTSIDYDKELNQPKKFLHDFAPILLNKLTNLGKEQWFSLFQIIKENFLQKHIMVYSKDTETQRKISESFFDGRIFDTDYDYLGVFNSNHGGTKTDLDIIQSVDIQTEISDSGSVINTLKISRNNTSDENNLNFMRVLVPKGSTLIDSSGFHDKHQELSASGEYANDPLLYEWDKKTTKGLLAIRSEAGKTEFSGWTQTPGKSTTEVIIKYLLPFKIKTSLLNQSQEYSLLFQKQPGSKETLITGKWIFIDRAVRWNSENTNVKGNTIEFNANGKTDTYWAAVIK